MRPLGGPAAQPVHRPLHPPPPKPATATAAPVVVAPLVASVKVSRARRGHRHGIVLSGRALNTLHVFSHRAIGHHPLMQYRKVRPDFLPRHLRIEPHMCTGCSGVMATIAPSPRAHRASRGLRPPQTPNTPWLLLGAGDRQGNV